MGDTCTCTCRFVSVCVTNLVIPAAIVKTYLGHGTWQRTTQYEIVKLLPHANVFISGLPGGGGHTLHVHGHRGGFVNFGWQF